MKGGREKPQRRLQEGNDVHGRRCHGPRRCRVRVSSRHHLSATRTWRGTPPRWKPQCPHKAQPVRHHANPMSMVPASTRTSGSLANTLGSHHPGPSPRRPRSCSRSAKGTTLTGLATQPKKDKTRRQQEGGTPTDTTLRAAGRRASRSLWDGMATSGKVRPGSGPPGPDQAPGLDPDCATTTVVCCTKAPMPSSPVTVTVRADRRRVRSRRGSSRAAGLRLPRRPLPRRSPMPPRGARTSPATGRRPAYPGMHQDPLESHRLRSRHH
jgi:hypothetical protein